MAVEVAMYVRNLREVEKAGASATARALLMRQMDSLGLTVGGKARNRWVIAADGAHQRETDPEASTPARPRPNGPTAKERLAGRGIGVIDGGA